jgi:hypothetical protein
MTPHIYYLDKDENKTLALLEQGFKSRQVAENCTIPLTGFHIFCADIRRKTGIQNIHDSREIRSFFSKYASTMAGTLTTPDQTRALRKFVEGKYLAGIAHSLQMSEPDAQALIDSALLPAAIFTRDERAQRAQARLYLAIFKPNFAPLSPIEDRILRLMAEGVSFLGITGTLGATSNMSFYREKAKEACIRLNFDVPGRNAQRNLLRAYFAHLDAQSPTTSDPMDDPLF